MFQTNTHNPKFKQNHTGFVNEQISLPLIPNRASSRSQVSNRKEMLEKQKIIFPDIQNSEGNFETLTEIDLDKENKQQLNKSNFTREVQEKLNFVLGEIPQYQQQSDDDIDADSYDFQAKINENKKILQQNRLRKDTNNNEASHKKNIVIPKQLWEKKKKVESLYQKRVKQYKGQSVQNKYLAKRKETIKEKIVNSQNNIQLPKKKQNGEKGTRQKNNHRRAMSHKGSIKSLASNEVLRNDNLFDGIQNYLENPRQIKKTENQKLVGLSLLKIKRQIEDKIKDINQKLGIQEVTENNQQKCLNITAKDWRRIEMNSDKLNYHHSNFEAEIDRVGSLQQKNSSCLEQYLQNQKMLLGINLHKKQVSRNININSQ